MEYPRAYIYLDIDNKDEFLNRLSKLLGSKTPILFEEELRYKSDHLEECKFINEFDCEQHLHNCHDRYSICINTHSVSEFFITAAADRNISIYWVDDIKHLQSLKAAHYVWKQFITVEDNLFTISSLVEDALDFGMDYIPEFSMLAKEAIEASLECKAIATQFRPLATLAKDYFKKACRYGIISRYDLEV